MNHIQSRTGGRNENQDFYGTTETKWGRLIVVCDGMGGHNGGRNASEISVNVVIDEMQCGPFLNPVDSIKAAIEKANLMVWQEGRRNPSLSGMGTTLVALLITPGQAICCHVGDSRIYQLRNGEILHRTFDHSYVFEQVKAGIMTEEEARISLQSNLLNHAVGLRPVVEIEITDHLSYKKGDRFLLCTDGIWGMVPEKVLVKMASLKADVETVISRMIETIDATGFKYGGTHDNLTAGMIEMECESRGL